MSNLTVEQLTFIEECLKEFSDRYSENDSDYQKVYDEGVPNPPIVSPWHTRSRFGYRERGNRSPERHNYNRDRQNYNRDRQNYNRDRDNYGRDQDYQQGRNSYKNNRSRPY